MRHLVVLLALSACKKDEVVGSGGSPAEVAEVVVSPASILLTESGESATLSAQLYDSDGNQVPGEVTWTTDDPDTSISADGTVTVSRYVDRVQTCDTASRR